MRIAHKMLFMKQISVTTLFLLFLAFVMESASAEVYKWVDEKGVVHFTDDITQVPERYRSKTENVGSPEEKEDTKVEGEAAPQKRKETYKDELGRGEDYWKGRVDEWRRKLGERQDRLETLRAKYNGLTEKFNDSKSTAERGNLRKERDQVKKEMDECKIQVEEAKTMLDKKIPEEVELYKAKAEWVK